MLFSKVKLYRYILFIFSLTVWSAAGIYYTGLNSIIDLIHFLSVPLLVSYLLIFKPEIIRKNIVSYGVFLALTALLTTGYLIAFSQSISQIRINWVELPIAVYFLLSVYLILWLLDKVIDLTFSVALRINQQTRGVTVKKTIKDGFRFAFLIFAVIPYLVAVFATHWIKFAGADNPQQLLDMEYQHVSFSAGDGAKLDGWFIPSTISMSDSAVIIAGGRSPTKNFFLPYARVLSNNGYNVLLFDPRGNGSSSGHKYSFGINEANDILSAADYLETKYAESSRYIFGFGINEGASALAAAAAGEDERFAGVVIDNASGYDISLPVWLSDCLPGWMEKALLKVMESVITIDIGKPAGGMKKLQKDISQISPCPILVTNSLKTDKSDRQRTIELYSKAKEPRMLWLAPPPTNGKQVIGFEREYFQNILELFDTGRANQQPGYWRTGRSGYGANVGGAFGRRESPSLAGRAITL